MEVSSVYLARPGAWSLFGYSIGSAGVEISVFTSPEGVVRWWKTQTRDPGVGYAATFYVPHMITQPTDSLTPTAEFHG